MDAQGWSAVPGEILGRTNFNCHKRYRVLSKKVLDNPKAQDVVRLFARHDLSLLY
jgi:hypothetical protein